jgi:hypothetical protein
LKWGQAFALVQVGMVRIGPNGQVLADDAPSGQNHSSGGELTDDLIIEVTDVILVHLIQSQTRHSNHHLKLLHFQELPELFRACQVYGSQFF